MSFTPSYVQAGSATATICDDRGERTLGPYGFNGYEGEWIELHGIVTGAAQPRYSLRSVADDLTFTTSIANAAADRGLAPGGAGMSGRAAITVAGADDAHFSRELQAVWSSLPVSLAAVPDGVSLVAVDGRHGEWVRAVAEAVRRGTGGVLVAGPVSGAPAADVRAVAVSAAERGIPVVVESAWASHPAIAPFAAAAAQRLDGIVLVDSVAVVAAGDSRALADVLLDHLALLRAVSCPVHGIRFATCDASGYTVGGVQDTGAIITLSSVRCAGPEPLVRLAMYGAAVQAQLIVPTGRTAAPAEAWFVDTTGRLAQPSWYESAARASWRRLLLSVTAHDTTNDLGGLAADIELAASATVHA